MIVGLGMTVGNHFGGIAADRLLWATPIATFLALIVVLAGLTLLHDQLIPVLVLLFIWGGLCFALVPTMQMRVMVQAQGAPSLAASVNIGAFNVGNGLGAVVGAAVLRSGYDYPAIPAASAIVFAAPLVIVLVAGVRRRKHVPA